MAVQLLKANKFSPIFLVTKETLSLSYPFMFRDDLVLIASFNEYCKYISSVAIPNGFSGGLGLYSELSSDKLKQSYFADCAMAVIKLVYLCDKEGKHSYYHLMLDDDLTTGNQAILPEGDYAHTGDYINSTIGRLIPGFAIADYSHFGGAYEFIIKLMSAAIHGTAPDIAICS